MEDKAARPRFDTLRRFFGVLGQWAGLLSVKLVAVVCVIIIPLNILIILISQRMVDNIQRELLTSYRDELAIFVTRLDDDFAGISRRLSEIGGEDWQVLGPATPEHEILRYRLWSELRQDRNSNNMIHAAWLRTHWDGRVDLTYDNNVVGYQDMSAIQDFMAGQDFPPYDPYQFQVLTIGGRQYLAAGLNYANFSLGFLTGLDQMMAVLKSLTDSDSSRFYLVDETGWAVTGGDALRLDLTSPEQALQLDGRTERYHVVSYPSQVIGHSVARIIPSSQLSEGVPLLEQALLVIAVAGVLVIPLMVFAIRRLVLRPLSCLDTAMQAIEGNQLDHRIDRQAGTGEFAHMYRVFNQMADRLQTLTIEAYEQEIEKLQIEETNLKLQINPHMLLNSLNMIHSLAQSRNYECIQQFSLSLVEYFRYALRKQDMLVPLGSEMHFVESYMDIQRIRFPGAFRFVCSIQPELEDRLVPPLLVQNFVENSVKYGLRLGTLIEISVQATLEAGVIHIVVQDNGSGMAPEMLAAVREGRRVADAKGEHIGMWNCRRRLKMFYGENASLDIQSERDHGTRVAVAFPAMTDIEEVNYCEAAYRG